MIMDYIMFVYCIISSLSISSLDLQENYVYRTIRCVNSYAWLPLKMLCGNIRPKSTVHDHRMLISRPDSQRQLGIKRPINNHNQHWHPNIALRTDESVYAIRKENQSADGWQITPSVPAACWRILHNGFLRKRNKSFFRQEWTDLFTCSIT